MTPFDYERLTPAQADHLRGLVAAADRLFGLRSPGPWRESMREACLYYLTRLPGETPAGHALDVAVEALVDGMPQPKPRRRARLNLVLGIVLVVLGIAGTILFLHLFMRPEAERAPLGWLIAGLFGYSLTLTCLPFIFGRR